ncbi:MAG: cysteine hydrolase [Chloroflexi bacterium]|nr:MAG: cysteine hydrolase [Chloroflexota bacterium]
MYHLPANTALIIVDVQEGLDDPYWGERNNPHAEENMALLLQAWRQNQRPIFHIHHNSVNPESPLRPGLPGNAIKAIVQPEGDEPVIDKTVNSAFIGTDLEDRLRNKGVDTVVVVGLTTNHCVSTTVRMAGNLGFNTYVVADATATHDCTGHDGQHYDAKTVHNMALASLHSEFATVVNTQDLLNL